MRKAAIVATGALLFGALALAAQDNSVDQIVYTHERGEVVQVAQPTATPVAQPVAVPVQSPTAMAQPLSDNLTPQQRNALWGFLPLKPGMYRIRPKLGGLCASMSQFNDKLEQSHLVLGDCSAYPRGSSIDVFALIPHPTGGYTIRTNAAPNMNQGMSQYRGILHCATIARGVVFGPARIDVRGCNFADGVSDWTRVGIMDQQFLLQPVTGGAYAIKGRSNDEQDFECWAPRGGNTGMGADLIRWSCTGGADQQFQLEWVAEIDTSEAPTLNAQNWIWTPDGYRRTVAADGVDIPQGDLTSFETIADNGAYCMLACSRERQCRAWTWKAALGLKNKPSCTLKSQISVPVNGGPDALGRMFSGIVRP